MNQSPADHFSGDKKTDYIEKLKVDGVFIVTDVKAFETLLLPGKYYVFFANLAEMNEHFLEMSRTFEQLYQNGSQKCILYDMSTHPSEGISGHFIICYADGVCVEDDVFRVLKLLQYSNVMKHTAEPRFGAKPPDDRAHAEMGCPKNCGGVKRKWICYHCLKTVHYGFNNCFYCGCGECDVRATQWWCQDSAHGIIFEQFSESGLNEELSEILHCKECNVLLLGETGAGKSTWINCLANYVSCRDLDTALERSLIYLVPSSFSIWRSRDEHKRIQVGESKNEIFETGQTATQKPKSYCFIYNNTRIRLIDAPGICDTRGPEHDKRNFDLILQKLQTVTELHAICVFLTPDDSRMTLAFQYCINELLTHLHKSAANNIVFCFTKTRQTLYRAGQTLPVLRSYLKGFEKRRNVEIPLTKETMYYFDNEAFRFLCACKDGIGFSDEEKNTYKESWDLSRAETFRFLKYLVGLKPYKLREIVSLNEARRNITILTYPLADIAANINLNISLIEDAKRKCKEQDLATSELESLLHIKQVTLSAIPVDSPKTVCASSKCSKVQTLPETNLKTVNYTQICHERCYCEDTEFGRYLDPRLRKCQEMSENQCCQRCGCNWEVHLHLTYRQEQREVTADLDKTTEWLLKAKQHQKIEKEDVLAAYDRQLAALEERRKKIADICAKFGTFEYYNSIIPLSDWLIDYLMCAIRLAEQQGNSSGNMERIESLKRFLHEYNEQVGILKGDRREEVLKITCDDVMRMKEELYSMTSYDCDIASYLQIVEEANNRHSKPDDRFFEADEWVLSGDRKNKLPEKSWNSGLLKRIPVIRSAVNSSK